MSEADQNASTTVNILPANTHADILLKLIEGQTQAATEIKNMNQRLFGGDGQPGALPILFQQISDNKKELLACITEQKKDTDGKFDGVDDKFEKVDEKHTDLDKKVTWYAGGIAAVGGLLGVGLTLLEIFHHH